MLIQLKISIFKKLGQAIMGPGPLRLLEKIKDHKSISQAAKSMNLSYVKALAMLNRLEQSLEAQLLIRKRGGKDRGGTELTPYATGFIAHYKRLEENINAFAEIEFQLFLERIKEVEQGQKGVQSINGNDKK